MRITAKELRLGNIVFDKQESREREVMFFDFESDNFINLEPIPITEQRLLVFGFELDEDLGDMIYYKKGKYIVSFDHEDLCFYRKVFNGIGCLIYDEPQFQYVHQLQNLYFALTGQELTI